VLGVESVGSVSRGSNGLRLLVRTIRHRQDGGVDLGVEVVESLLRGGVEPGERQLDRLLLVAEDGERLADLLQAAGGDDVIQAALLEAETDRLCPLGEVLGELLVLAPVRLHLADDDAGFDGAVSVVLLKPVREAVEESLVHDSRPDEPIRLALALRVGGGDGVEARGRTNVLPDLLQVDALALKDGLQAHHPLRPEVDLIQQQDRALLHSLHDGTVDELRLAVDEAEAAEQIVLVRLRGDVDANEVAPVRRADLLDHRGLAVARQTRDVDGRELLRREDRGDGVVVTPRHERIVLGGDEGDFGHGEDEVVGVAVHVAHSIRSFGGVKWCWRRFFNFFNDGCRSIIVQVRVDHGMEDRHLRDQVHATRDPAAVVVHKPRRRHPVRAHGAVGPEHGAGCDDLFTAEPHAGIHALGVHVVAHAVVKKVDEEVFTTFSVAAHVEHLTPCPKDCN